MKKNVCIVVLSDEEVEHLQKMVREGWATDIESKMYYHVYNLNEQDLEESVNSWI